MQEVPTNAYGLPRGRLGDPVTDAEARNYEHLTVGGPGSACSFPGCDLPGVAYFCMRLECGCQRRYPWACGPHLCMYGGSTSSMRIPCPVCGVSSYSMADMLMHWTRARIVDGLPLEQCTDAICGETLKYVSQIASENTDVNCPHCLEWMHA